MKKIAIYSLLVLFFATFMSCKKDETKVYLAKTPTAPTLSTPNDNQSIVLAEADKDKPFTAFTWTAADYGFDASIQYLVQYSKYPDMKRAKLLASVEHATSYNLTNLAFDQFLLGNLKLTPNVATKVYFRVVASVAGLPSSDYPAGGATTAIRNMTVTPFNTPVDVKSWGIVGSATPNGWNGPDFVMDDGDNADEYVATVNLVAGEIKFRFNNNWDNNLGGSNGKLTSGGSNIPIAVAGTYTITLNTKALTYSIVKL